jgi:hypothetical protein
MAEFCKETSSAGVVWKAIIMAVLTVDNRVGG